MDCIIETDWFLQTIMPRNSENTFQYEIGILHNVGKFYNTTKLYENY